MLAPPAWSIDTREELQCHRMTLSPEKAMGHCNAAATRHWKGGAAREGLQSPDRRVAFFDPITTGEEGWGHRDKKCNGCRDEKDTCWQTGGSWQQCRTTKTFQLSECNSGCMFLSPLFDQLLNTPSMATTALSRAWDPATQHKNDGTGISLEYESVRHCGACTCVLICTQVSDFYQTFAWFR